ncbi:hypothetical protein AC249_AIPGENE27505 [Exaiptasia diaphana]|nr:hypothetical protein AC249_AIPGENE27505 [Exaiptasia diaphana]
MAGSAGAAAAAHMDYTAGKMTEALVAIVNSSWFDKESFQTEKLKLSQAFCLLWQDPESGDVSGRKSGVECQAAAAAAGIVDLIVMDRVEIEVQPNKTLGIKDDNILLKVKNEKPTGTYLDGPLFDDIAEHHNKKPGNPEKVKKVIWRDIAHMRTKSQVATNTLDSLVELGILDMKEKFVGRKYPTAKPGVEESLRDQIRSVVLDGAEPNSYIHALLIISRMADKVSMNTPVLKKCFTKDEYDRAKDKMNAMIDFSNDKK